MQYKSDVTRATPSWGNQQSTCLHLYSTHTYVLSRQVRAIDIGTMSYRNEEHVKGVVDVAVPDGFVDLSTVHSPLGELFSQVEVPARLYLY